MSSREIITCLKIVSFIRARTWYLGVMTKFILILLTLPSLALATCDEVSRSYPTIDPIDGLEWQVTTKEFLPSAKAPLVFIVPPIVGETVLDRRMAARLCANGIAASIVQVVKVVEPEREVRDVRIHDESYIRAAHGISVLIDAYKANAGLNGRFGILGMSLGGMLSAYVAGADSRILASVIIAGAGNAAGVLANSDQELVVNQREARMRALSIPDVASYETLLRSVISHDPLSVAGNIAPKSSYLFIANSDGTVPTRYQFELREAIREPLVFVMRAGHTSGLVKAATVHAGKITSFFVKRLK